MSFGETLRAAREAKGLTCSEVAMQTRLLVQIVEEMEQEDFHRIAAPIYGRGFVRLYASCVGLDPTPLVAEFMEIYEGHRAPIVKTRAVPTTQDPPAPQPPLDNTPPIVDYASPADPPPPPPMPDFGAHPSEISTAIEEAATEPPAAEDPIRESPAIETPFGEKAEAEQTEPEQVPEPTASEAPESEQVLEPTPPLVDEPAPTEKAEIEPPPPPPPPAEPTPPPALRGLDLFEQAYANQNESTVTAPSRPLDESPFLPPSYEEEEGPSAGERFRQGLSNVSLGILTTVKRIPRSTWRFSFLGISCVAVLALISFACVKLYQFTTPPSTQQPNAPVAEQTKPSAPQPQTVSAEQTKKKAPEATKAPVVQKPAQPTKPKVPGALRSTGQKIPSLYVD